MTGIKPGGQLREPPHLFSAPTRPNTPAKHASAGAPVSEQRHVSRDVASAWRPLACCSSASFLSLSLSLSPCSPPAEELRSGKEEAEGAAAGPGVSFGALGFAAVSLSSLFLRGWFPDFSPAVWPGGPFGVKRGRFRRHSCSLFGGAAGTDGIQVSAALFDLGECWISWT